MAKTSVPTLYARVPSSGIAQRVHICTRYQTQSGVPELDSRPKVDGKNRGIGFAWKFGSYATTGPSLLVASPESEASFEERQPILPIQPIKEKGHAMAGIHLAKHSPGERYLTKEGRESRKEIEDSAKSPGAGRIAAKNRLGAVYCWLIYDFEVGKSKLKDGHIQYLNNKILPGLQKYGSIHNKTGTVLISGHASPSGKHGSNVNLAKSRADAVLKHLARSVGIRNKSWFYVKQHDQSELYSVVKGTPSNAKLRAFCRGVYVNLWLIAKDKPTEKFSKKTRKRARGLVYHRFPRYEEAFYIWVIENWDYLISLKNRYVRERFPRDEGLFFKPPVLPITTDREVWHYLKCLYTYQFKAATTRLRNKHMGVGGTMLRAGGDPVRCYQQLARWIVLDNNTRKSGTYLFTFMPNGSSVRGSMNQLITWINEEKFGKKAPIWDRIAKDLRKYSIPMKVIKTPTF